MSGASGVIRGVNGRAGKRAVVAGCLLAMAGCLTTEWTPLPHPIGTVERVLVKAPVEDPQRPGRWHWEETLLLTPSLEGDSMLVGPALSGGEMVWTGQDYRRIGRVTVDGAMVGRRRIDWLRTTLFLSVAVGALDVFGPRDRKPPVEHGPGRNSPGPCWFICD